MLKNYVINLIIIFNSINMLEICRISLKTAWVLIFKSRVLCLSTIYYCLKMHGRNRLYDTSGVLEHLIRLLPNKTKLYVFYKIISLPAVLFYFFKDNILWVYRQIHCKKYLNIIEFFNVVTNIEVKLPLKYENENVYKSTEKRKCY